MRLLLLLFNVLNFLSVVGQDFIYPCNCNTFIEWSKVDTLSFDGEQNLELLYRSEIPCDNDEYKIIKDSLGLFQIIRDDYVKSHLDTFRISKQVLWIKKQNIFCVFTRYHYENNFIIYSQPDKNSTILIERELCDEELGLQMTIISCKNEWIKIIITLGGINYSGWIENKITCPLKCTTCT